MVTNPNWDFHEINDKPKRHKRVNRLPDGSPIRDGVQPRDTLVSSREVIVRVNKDPLYRLATQTWDIWPKALYNLLRSARFDEERVRDVLVFVYSLDKDKDWFSVDANDGNYTELREIKKERARKCFQSMILNWQPIIEKFAGETYWAWKNGEWKPEMDL